MKLAFAASTLAMLITAAASAADLPARKAPVAVAYVYDWSGIYIGGDIGRQTSEIGLSRPASIFGAAGTISYDPSHQDIGYGGHAGIQRQWGQFVLGVEGAYLRADGTAKFNTPLPTIFFPGATGFAYAKMNDIWTVGGRAGWAPSNILFYGTVGYAEGSFDFRATSPAGTYGDHASARLGGYYVGGGVEWAPLSNGWVIGVEYRHYDFDAKSATAQFFPAPFNNSYETVKFDPTAESVMARVSYKFGDLGFILK